MELRQRLYDEVRDYADDKHLALVPEGMQLQHSETLRYTLTLIDGQSRADLLAMTPTRLASQRRTPRGSHRATRTFQGHRFHALRLFRAAISIQQRHPCANPISRFT